MFNVTSYELGLIAGCSFLSLLSLLVLLHCAQLLWKYRNRCWMQPRHSEFEIIALSSVGLLYIMNRPMNLFHDFVTESKAESELRTSKHIFRVVIAATNTTVISYLVLGLMVDSWHQYFNAKLAVQTDIALWRSMMDETFGNDGVNWFVRNKHTWGNRAFLDRLLCLIWCPIILIGFALPAVFETSDAPIYLTLGLIALLSSLLFWFQYPPFSDEIYVRQEKRLLGWVVCFYFCSWIFFGNLKYVLGWNLEEKRMKIYFLYFVSNSILSTFFPALLYVQSPMVIAHFLPVSRSCSLFGGYFVIPLCFDDESDSHGSSLFLNAKESVFLPNSKLNLQIGQHSQGSHRGSVSLHNHSNLNLSKIKLTDVLADNHLFRRFVKHLFASYCGENILCWMECIKYRQKMQHLLLVHSPFPSSNENGKNQRNNNKHNHKGIVMEGSPPSLMNQHLEVSFPIQRKESEFEIRMNSSNHHYYCSDINDSTSYLVDKQMTDIKKVPLIAKELAEKYLANGSGYQVNVSFVIQKHILDLVDHIDLNDLSHFHPRTGLISLFDPIIRETERLLRESLSRFIQNEEYGPLE